jgi:DNA repair exonuclease SbcCD ATPase subunit
MPIQKIAHLADIHIPKSTKRHAEYREVFNNLIVSLRAQSPDRIVIVGDLFNDYIKIEGELLILSSKLLNALSRIAPVVITRGNHDILKSAPNRIDSIQAVVEAISNPKVTYLNTTGFFEDENIVWAVWKHGEKKNNPWADKTYVRDTTKTYIDLFHDPVNGCLNAEGYTFDSKTYRSLKDFKGDLSFFGDIHMLQYFEEKTKAYCGSLIPQNHSEGNDQFHGYLMWNLQQKTVDEITIANKYNFHTIVVNRFTDFDNLDIEIPNKSEKPSIRVKWQTLPATKNVENERKLYKYIKDKFEPVAYKDKTEFIEENEVDIQENSVIENITKREVLHGIISDFLKKIGEEDDIIAEVLNVDQEIESRLELEEMTNIQWSILRFYGKNFRNIGEVDIDWRQYDGVFQITGKNTAGKSSIIQLLSYILYGKTIETEKTKKFGDARFVNNRVNTNSCEGYVVLGIGSEYYGIKRVTTLQRTKDGQLKGSPTVVSYYKLADPDEVLSDNNNIEKLDDDNKHKTQKRISEIIGSYDNFIRIILTTSDTLNKVLDTDSSVFIDSILTDSGLDVFDLRLTEFKKYRKEVIAIDRIVCKPEIEESAITYMQNQIYEKDKLILENIASINLLETNIAAEEALRDQTLEMIHPINSDIANVDVDKVNRQIKDIEFNRDDLKRKENFITHEIWLLKPTYNSERLAILTKKREEHKNEEFKLRTEINNHRLAIGNIESQVIRFNGQIDLLKKEGATKKAKIAELKNSTTCSECGQPVKEDAQEHIQKRIKEIEIDMFAIVPAINNKLTIISELKKNIAAIQQVISDIEITIARKDAEFESDIIEIGELNNDKISFEKRKELEAELNGYPLLYENMSLKIDALNDKIVKYNELIDKIAENVQIRERANKYSANLDEMKHSKDRLQEENTRHRSDIDYNTKQIKIKNQLLDKFKAQEKMDRVYNLYEKCIHRDGVPTQILSNILLPKINNSLSNLLQPVEFNVWLDESDLKLKMSYANHPNAVIDCIGGSGKERTFSSISLKVALNEINSKSKPTIFMLDEIMGKLKDESIDEFLEFLKVIKKKVNKMIIIEQNHEINPDYVITAVVGSNGVSTIKLELNQ